MNTKGILKLLLKILISGGIITIMVLNLKGDRLAETLQSISWWQLALALLFYLLCQLVSTVRWLVLAHSMGLGGGIGQFYAFYLMGMFFNLFLPTAIGGDLGKAMLLARDKASTWARAFLSILSDRFCGLIALLTISLVSLLVMRPPQWQSYSIGFVFVLAGATVFTVFFRWIERHPWGERFVQRFILRPQPGQEDPGEIWPHRKPIFTAVAIGLAFHGLSIALQVWLLGQLDISISFFVMAAIYGLAGLASMIPLSLNGIGLREGSMALLLVHWAQVPQTVATVFSLVWLSILLLATLPGAALMLKRQVHLPKIERGA